MTTPTIYKHPTLTLGKYTYQVYKLGDTPQASTLIVRRVSNPGIAWTVSLVSTPEYATSCRVAIPMYVHHEALELLKGSSAELFPLDVPVLTTQTIKPVWMREAALNKILKPTPSPTPTPKPLQPALLRTIRINRLINDYPIATRLAQFKTYNAIVLDCLLEPLRNEALNHCFYYLAVKPALRLTPDALKELITITCTHDANLFSIVYNEYNGMDIIDSHITLYTNAKHVEATKDYSKLHQVLDLLGYEVFCHSSNRDILITLYNIYQ